MLQQFYNNTLQSNYIKYILANTYIPTIPFTSNIFHVTKGNKYIFENYIVTAKISDSVTAIEERLSNAQNSIDRLKEYEKIFIQHQPYVFGRQYLGLTTNYISNSSSYDPTTHYYLGEYLRAYKAFYGIDLMPYYNCFSNEYIDYLSLETKSNEMTSYVSLNKNSNLKYSIISVPIKFCKKYTIALNCSQQVKMLPVFIGKKGLLEEKTLQLNSLNYWGKTYNSINYSKPIIYESPHINSVSDMTQSALQTYDKYLRLLIQIPANLKTPITVLEGEYRNSNTYAEKIINTSKEDVEKNLNSTYTNKIPYSQLINVPSNSTLICEDISRQKIYKNYDNIPFLAQDENSTLENNLVFSINDNNFNWDKRIAKIPIDYYLSQITPSNIEDDTSYKISGVYEINHSIKEDGTFIPELDIDSIKSMANNESNPSIIKEYRNFVFYSGDDEEFNGIDFEIIGTPKLDENGNELKDSNNNNLYNYENPHYNLYYISTDKGREDERQKIIQYRYDIDEEGNQTFIQEFINDKYSTIGFKENYYIDENFFIWINNFTKPLSETVLAIDENGGTTDNSIYNVCFDLNWFKMDKDVFGSNYMGVSHINDINNITYNTLYKVKLNSDKFGIYKSKGSFINDESILYTKEFTTTKNTIITWDNIFGTDDNNFIVILETLDNNDKAIRDLIAEKNDNNEIKFYIRELSTTLKKEDFNSSISINIKNSNLNPIFDDYKLFLNIDNLKNIKSNPEYSNDNTYYYDNWNLTTIASKVNFTEYLNNYLYSDLSLLKYLGNNSYAFSNRLLEYLLDNVITKNDQISKNTIRVQESINYPQINGVWDDNLRVNIFNSIVSKSKRLDKSIPKDINGFVDKDSEKLLSIKNKTNHGVQWQ